MPDEPRLTVALTFDHDAISDAVRRGDSPVKLSATPSSGRASGRSGSSPCSRERGDPGDLVRPGPHADDVPRRHRRDPRGGHELACHGWFHEDFAELERGRGSARSWRGPWRRCGR